MKTTMTICAMKNKKLAPCAAIAGLVLAFISPTAVATDGIICTGTVHRLGVHTLNKVMLQLSGMNARVQICNLEQTLGTIYPISATQCKAAYATLMAAHFNGKSMTIYFDNVQAGTSCSTFLDWEVATARWVYLAE
jgi:hypothetical protein